MTHIVVIGGGIAGIGVRIAARVSGLAGAGEVLVSRTVRDLVTGSGLSFAELGARRLKGIEGALPLYAARL